MSIEFNAEQQSLFESLLMARRDVRGNHFLRDEPITDEELQRILEAALWAPSVGFSQPWKFVVIRSTETKHKIAHSFKKENEKAAHLFDERQKQYQQLKLEGIHEAPVNIAVYYQAPSKPVLGQTSMQEMGEYSVVCAVQNMWLMARAMNIGIGWVSILDPDSVSKALNTPLDHKLVAYLCVGKVDEFLERPELEALKWEKRKSLEESLMQESF
jgi:5,6-dimethylbenzimidazole synthase